MDEEASCGGFEHCVSLLGSQALLCERNDFLELVDG